MTCWAQNKGMWGCSKEHSLLRYCQRTVYGDKLDAVFSMYLLEMVPARGPGYQTPPGRTDKQRAERRVSLAMLPICL